MTTIENPDPAELRAFYQRQNAQEIADLERRLRESPTEQVGWIDEHGQLWGLAMRSGDVTTDRPVYARAVLGEGTDG